MLSTRNLSPLPEPATLRRLMRSLAMLEAILSPEWDYRYYSFNSAWSAGELMGSMRNGQGDYWFALFCKAGVAIHGLAHEVPGFRFGQRWPGIFDELPPELHQNFLHEPAFTSEDSTFCIWRLAGAERWSVGSVELPAGDDPDGSAHLLGILAGDPEQYVQFASDYYEREIELADVAKLYRHEPLTAKLVERLNPETTLEDLAADMAEIGYPEPS
jgi:hypothetical protein